uniref:Uncharacterized protein n=1 Tax=Lates calcarifer TaxID=8187 RepID=A0A4W6DZ70_LATCA
AQLCLLVHNKHQKSSSMTQQIFVQFFEYQFTIACSVLTSLCCPQTHPASLCCPQTHPASLCRPQTHPASCLLCLGPV